jgi:hypothetical protein
MNSLNQAEQVEKSREQAMIRPQILRRLTLAAWIRCLVFAVAVVLLTLAAPASATAHSPDWTLIGEDAEELEHGSLFHLVECPTDCHILQPSLSLNIRLEEPAGGTDASNPMVVPFAGRLAAITVLTGKPTATHLVADEAHYGKPSFRLAVLTPTTMPHTYVLAAESEPEILTPSELGMPVTRAIRPIAVNQGEVVALAVPSWLPAYLGTEPPLPEPDRPAAGAHLEARPSSCDVTTEPQAVWEPAPGTALAFACELQGEVPYGATLLSPSLHPVPKFWLSLHTVSRGHGSHRRAFLESVTMGGLQRGEDVRIKCQIACLRVTHRIRLVHSGPGRVTFSDLNYRLSRHELQDIELSATAPGHIGRNVLLAVQAGGRYGKLEMCLLPETTWWSEGAFGFVVGCE